MRGCEWGDSWYVREFGGEEGGIEGGKRWRGRQPAGPVGQREEWQVQQAQQGTVHRVRE